MAATITPLINTAVVVIVTGKNTAVTIATDKQTTANMQWANREGGNVQTSNLLLSK